MSIQYQLRDEPSVHYIIDVFKAAKAQLPESKLTKEEKKAYRRYSAWIQKLLKLERDRQERIDGNALAWAGQNRGVFFFDFICVELATRKIKKLDSRIMSMEVDPTMTRILAAGTAKLHKNPRMETWRERQKERNRLDHVYMIIKGK